MISEFFLIEKQIFIIMNESSFSFDIRATRSLHLWLNRSRKRFVLKGFWLKAHLWLSRSGDDQTRLLFMRKSQDFEMKYLCFFHIESISSCKQRTPTTSLTSLEFSYQDIELNIIPRSSSRRPSSLFIENFYCSLMSVVIEIFCRDISKRKF